MQRIKTIKECNAVLPENRLRIAVKTIVRMALREGKKERKQEDVTRILICMRVVEC